MVGGFHIVNFLKASTFFCDKEGERKVGTKQGGTKGRSDIYTHSTFLHSHLALRAVPPRVLLIGHFFDAFRESDLAEGGQVDLQAIESVISRGEVITVGGGAAQMRAELTIEGGRYERVLQRRIGLR